MRINLDYQRKPEAAAEVPNQALTADYIDFAASNVHKDGLEGQQLRTFARLQRKLDAAVEAKQDEIELAEDEKDFLRKTFDKVKVPANLAKFFVVLEDEIEEATSKKKQQANVAPMERPRKRE
jgi:hypothetical protein